MAQILPLTQSFAPGLKRGRLTLLCKVKGDRKTYWNCRCDCGVERRVRVDVLRRDYPSCGCVATEKLKKFATTHGAYSASKSTYRSYCSMIDRCTNPNHPHSRHYLERGITICDRWLGPDGPANFIADMGVRPPNTSLDRIDNDGGYEPSNCRWATAKEQQRNKRANVLVEYCGESLSVSEWAERFGIDPEKPRHRLKRGWDFEAAIGASSSARTRS